MPSRNSSWDRWSGFSGDSGSERWIINDPLSSGEELPSPHGSQTPEPESEAEPSPPPPAASKASSSSSPPPAPAGSHYSDTQFYVVWLPAHCSGIWIGRGSSAWWTLVEDLPNGRYTKGICRLRKTYEWAEAWNLWWTGGGPEKQELDPFIIVV